MTPPSPLGQPRRLPEGKDKVMGGIQVQCPDCGRDANAVLGQAVWPSGRLTWSRSITCEACGSAIEEDNEAGVGPKSPPCDRSALRRRAAGIASKPTCANGPLQPAMPPTQTSTRPLRPSAVRILADQRRLRPALPLSTGLPERPDFQRWRPTGFSEQVRLRFRGHKTGREEPRHLRLPPQHFFRHTCSGTSALCRRPLLGRMEHA
jgi:hypothetical protein